MTPDNDWYGHKAVLASYCGLSRPRPIFGYLPHGYQSDYWEVYDSRKVTAAPVFMWNMRHVDQVRSRGGRNVRCIGTPFGYLVADRFGDATPEGGEGTISFPAHSAEGRIVDDAEAFVTAVMRDLPPPYTVSVYYQDLEDSTEVYRDAGWSVVSFGSRSTTTFLIDLADAMARHEVVASNVVQTSVWYGAALGRRSIVLPTPVEPIYPGHLPEVARLRWPALYDLRASLEETTALGRWELGFDHRLPPADLVSALGWDSPAKMAVARAVRMAALVRHRNAAVHR